MTATKCLQANSIPIPIHLATGLKDTLKYLASDAAIFVQQIHFWQSQGYGVLHEGRRWIYNRYQDWLSQLPWLTDYAFRKIKAVLLGMKIIEVKALADHGRDRTLYYAINHEHELVTDFLVDDSTDGAENMTAAPSVDSTTSHTKTTFKSSPETTKAVVSEEEMRRAIANAPFAQETNPPEMPAPPPVKQSICNQEHVSQSQELLSRVRSRIGKLSPTLQQLVLGAEGKIVQSAIAAFDEADKGNRVQNPVAYLTSAIRGGWKPKQPQVSATQQEFLKAYERLVASGVVAYQDVRHMTLDSYGEPLLKPLPGHQQPGWLELVPWRDLAMLNLDKKYLLSTS